VTELGNIVSSESVGGSEAAAAEWHGDAVVGAVRAAQGSAVVGGGGCVRADAHAGGGRHCFC